MTHATTTDGVWRVMRFENEEGKYAEVASNHVGPEAIPVPDGYRFVSSVEMVPRVVTDEMVDRAAEAVARDYPISARKLAPLTVAEIVYTALAAALEDKEAGDA